MMPPRMPPAASATMMTAGCRCTVRRHEHRVEQVALDLLDDHDGRQHERRVEQAAGHERDQHRDEAGHEGADERNEGCEEGDDHQRHNQRHADDGQRDADQDRVDEPDERDAAHVPGEGGVRAAPELVGVAPRAVPEQAEQEAPDALAVLEQEEGRAARR